jgi:hypothetical protein
MATTLETTGASAPQSDPIVLRAPVDARIHTVRVRVDLNRPWLEAVTAGAPDTEPNHHVTTAGPLHPPIAGNAADVDFVLINYRRMPYGVRNWDRAIAWAKDVGLEKTIHREAFAVGEHCPNLHVELKGGLMHVAATTEYGPYVNHTIAYAVFWDGKRRFADVHWPIMLGSKGTWFLFRSPRPIRSTKHFRAVTLEG